MIPVYVSPNSLDYIHKKHNTQGTNENLRCMQKKTEDHHMFTPGTIKKVGININGSIIEAFMQA